MKLNTVIQLPDGRVGTICYNNLDGTGGVWGRHIFIMPERSFGDELPGPDFLLRTHTDYLHAILIKDGAHKPDVELVGPCYEIVGEGATNDE